MPRDHLGGEGGSRFGNVYARVRLARLACTPHKALPSHCRRRPPSASVPCSVGRRRKAGASPGQGRGSGQRAPTGAAA